MIIKNIALILAAGRGHRMSRGTPKQYLDVGGITILRRTVNVFLKNPTIDLIQVIIHPDDRELYETAVGDIGLPEPVLGGKTRQNSVLNGLEAIGKHFPEYVYIHDAARPFLEQKTLNSLICEVDKSGAVIPALRIRDTIKCITEETIHSTLDRDYLYCAQTPQAFRYKAIFMAHRRFENINFTDDSAIAEKAGLKVRIIEGLENNFKITTKEDLNKANIMTKKYYTDVRIGYGVDVHAFDKGDHVILGGVKIPHTMSLKGHSDADVAIHAITDAVLGAIAAGDIGEHFPPSDPEWKNISSDVFLKHAVNLVAKKKGIINSIDITIVCEEPKIGPYRDLIRSNISKIMDFDIDRISIKATTTERLGFTGKGQGIMVHAVATIKLLE